MVDEKKAKNIARSIQQCKKCQGISNDALRVANKEVGLSYLYPQNIPIRIMFIAESPPAPGKGFFYDSRSSNTSFRDKLFKLINEAGLGYVGTITEFNSKGYYLADAINCRYGK